MVVDGEVHHEVEVDGEVAVVIVVGGEDVSYEN